MAGLEREHPDKKFALRNQDLIVDHIDFEDAGANSWVTSEAYLDEHEEAMVKEQALQKLALL